MIYKFQAPLEGKEDFVLVQASKGCEFPTD
jgi:hypothetical protein